MHFQANQGPHQGQATPRVTVAQLAALVEGKVHGDENTVIQAARPLGEAGPDDISFVCEARYLEALKTCSVRALVLPTDLVQKLSLFLSGQLSGDASSEAPQGTTVPLLIEVQDPLTAFITIASHLHGLPEPAPTGIDSAARIHPSVQIGPDPSIHPFVVIGEGTTVGARCRLHPGVVIGRECQLGDDVVLYPGVVLYDRTVLGNRVILHAHAVIGADGYGYRQREGRHVKVPQLGWVEIGDDVEIGAHSAVDRGTFKPTRIGVGTKIDNLVQVGHNCQVGKHNLFASQVGIAGSCVLGNYVVLGGQAGLSDHLHMGDGAIAGAQAGVITNVEAGQRVWGYPAHPAMEMKRMIVSLRRLPEAIREFRQMQQKKQKPESESDSASAA